MGCHAPRPQTPSPLEPPRPAHRPRIPSDGALFFSVGGHAATTRRRVPEWLRPRLVTDAGGDLSHYYGSGQESLSTKRGAWLSQTKRPSVRTHTRPYMDSHSRVGVVQVALDIRE